VLAVDAVLQPVCDLTRPVEQIAERRGDCRDASVGPQQDVVPGLDARSSVRRSRQPAQQLRVRVVEPVAAECRCQFVSFSIASWPDAARVVDLRGTDRSAQPACPSSALSTRGFPVVAYSLGGGMLVGQISMFMRSSTYSAVSLRNVS
jgi:hypothetical protein